MLAFAFLNPQSIRLLLDRSRYEGIVLPSIGLKADSVVKTYTEAVDAKRPTTPVFIYPDIPTLTTVVRSGALDMTTGKHILCASVSVLARHDLDAIDATVSDSMWRVRANLSSIMNSALSKDVGITDDVVAKIMNAPDLPEQRYSNPIVKADERPCTELSEIATMLNGHEQKQAILVALLRYVTWSYVADQASALGSTALEITKAAQGKLLVASNKAFAADAKAKGLRIPAAVLARARTMFRTSAPATIINFAVRRFGGKRPYSLAVAESGCLSGNASIVETSGLRLEHFPRPSQTSVAPVRIPSPSMAGLTTLVEPGVYSFTQLMNMIGERVEHAFDVVRRTQSRIVFNRNPTWQDNDNCWNIDTGNDFYMLYGGIKYRFCTAEAAQPVAENKVTLDTPKIVIRKKPKPVPAAAPAAAQPARRHVAALVPAAPPKKAVKAALATAKPAVKSKALPAPVPPAKPEKRKAVAVVPAVQPKPRKAVAAAAPPPAAPARKRR